MKIDDLITETPQLIPGVNQAEVQQAIKDCYKALDSGRANVVEKLSNTSVLYVYENDVNSGIYFLVTDGGLSYLARYTRAVLPDNVGARQVLIKRSSQTDAYAAGIGKKIFWDYLFPKHNCVVSDSQQTTDGRSFWLYRISEAFDKGFTVKLVNTNDKTFVVVRNADELNRLSPDIWGESKWFQRVVLVITN